MSEKPGCSTLIEQKGLGDKCCNAINGIFQTNSKALAPISPGENIVINITNQRKGHIEEGADEKKFVTKLICD